MKEAKVLVSALQQYGVRASADLAMLPCQIQRTLDGHGGCDGVEGTVALRLLVLHLHHVQWIYSSLSTNSKDQFYKSSEYSDI